MESFAKIPISFIMEMDDVGWHDGRDYTAQGRASRSGIDRFHSREDYEFLRKLTQGTGKHIAAALCVADWDRENILRGEVGITHDPYGWDKASEINAEEQDRCLKILENAGVDYMLHGVLHGRYDENGKCITECEHMLSRKNEDGTITRYLPSEEDFERRLELFFRIYNARGMKQKVLGFVMPCGNRFSTEADAMRVTAVLHKFGIRYWADNFLYPEFANKSLKVYNGVACFKWGTNRTSMPWDQNNIDPKSLQLCNLPDSGKYVCLHGSHWTNYLNLDPKKNEERLADWIDFVKRQGEVWGSMNADTLPEAVNQLFYFQFAKEIWEDGKLTLDLAEVEKNKLDCHKNVFYLAVKNERIPSSVEGGTISLYEKHDEFALYRIEHTSERVTVSF